MQPRLAAIGYVDVKTRAPSILGDAGTVFRGHQFRYSHFTTAKPPSTFSVTTRRGMQLDEGYGSGSVLASYVHAHWASNPNVAANFVRACAAMLASDSFQDGRPAW